MKRFVTILFFLLIAPIANGQEFAFFGGINNNTYFDYQKEEGHFRSDYTSGQNFCLGISMNDIDLKKLTLDLSLSYEKYSGEIYISDGGLGASQATEAKVAKTIVSLAAYPFQAKLLKDRLKLKAGLEFALLINDKVDGRKFYSNILGESMLTILDDETNFTYNKRLGINLGIQYQLHLNNRLYLQPAYIVSLGLSGEMLDAQANISSFIQRLVIGVAWSIHE